MNRVALALLAGSISLWLIPPAGAQVRVLNPGFEADRFSLWPGTADANGKAIDGWSYQGNVGINPIQPSPNSRPGQDPAPFFDNGGCPEGRQVLFMQNQASLRQDVDGFVKGTRYRIVFRENARHNNAPERNPRLRVGLGGEILVSEHDVQPVGEIGIREMPFARVESAVFTAPGDGAFALVFETTFADRVAVLLDDIRIEVVTGLEDAEPERGKSPGR
ncbi:MAG: hypothetical protein JXR77_02980 [Lentisphaeria bacterium]|nr:hypothetical protein [Lentisphaeria bacterium]